MAETQALTYTCIHTYIQAHARTRTRLILNLYCITSTSEMLSNVVYKFTCANCNKLKPELNMQAKWYGVFVQMTKLAFSYRRWESVHALSKTPHPPPPHPCTRTYAFGITPFRDIPIFSKVTNVAYHQHYNNNNKKKLR